MPGTGKGIAAAIRTITRTIFIFPVEDMKAML